MTTTETTAATVVATSADAMSENLVTKSTAAAAPLSSPSEGDKCPFHGIGTTLFCKDEGCQRSICEICVMKNHSYHDVIAPENGFLYCRDSSTVDTAEMLCAWMEDMSIAAGKMEPDVSPGNRNRQSEVEANEGTGNQTKPDEQSLTPVIEIVYDTERDQKKYFEAESQSAGVSLNKGMFWYKNFKEMRCTKLKKTVFLESFEPS